jgi:M6 family metalloprotease-like protein
MAALFATVLVFICALGDVPAEVSKQDQPAKIPMLILLIEYTDCKLALTDEVWNKKVFALPTKEEEDQRFDVYGASGSSVNNYYKEVTCGRFLFEPAVETCGTTNDGVIRVSVNMKHPLEEVNPMVQAVNQAVTKASQFMDFPRYDVDKNKLISQMELAFVVVSAGGYGNKTGSKNRCYRTRLNLGGLRKNEYVVVTERRDDLKDVYKKLTTEAGVEPKYTDFPVSIGTLVHELGHLFGSPDLYNVGHLTALSGGQKNGSTAFFPGTKLEYVRGMPCHYGAYTMFKAGFIQPVVLETNGVYAANSAGSGKYNIYRISTKDPKEYFLIENRQFEGFDGTLGTNVNNRSLKSGGIAIWHISEAFGNNQDMDKKLVDIEEASEATLGYSHIKKNKYHNPCDPFYPLEGNSEFSSNSTPSNLTYGGEPQPWKISDFSAPASVMTFRFTRL